MGLTFSPLHPTFVAEVSPVDLNAVRDRSTFDEIRAAMDRYAVLVFRDQPFTDAEQMDFAQRFDGELHAKTGAAALGRSRLGTEAIADISNVDESGEILASQDRRRMYAMGNRLWHTDASFQDPPGRYSMLSARVIPPVAADTEFADMRAAYDELDPATRDSIEALRVHHTILHSRHVLGFDFTPEEQAKLTGAVQSALSTRRAGLTGVSKSSRRVSWDLTAVMLAFSTSRVRSCRS